MPIGRTQFEVAARAVELELVTDGGRAGPPAARPVRVDQRVDVELASLGTGAPDRVAALDLVPDAVGQDHLDVLGRGDRRARSATGRAR